MRHSRRNDPELDARLTLEHFGGQLEAFRDAPEGLLTAWHWLTSADDTNALDDSRVSDVFSQQGLVLGNTMLGTIDL